MSSFTKPMSDASLTERHGHTQQSFTSSSINYWHAVPSWKGSQTFRWSVRWIFQLTNRPSDTLHQSAVWSRRGHASSPRSATQTCVHIHFQPSWSKYLYSLLSCSTFILSCVSRWVFVLKLFINALTRQTALYTFENEYLLVSWRCL